MSFAEEPPPESRLGPAPAPLDLGRLEIDARTAAAKHVASLLQVKKKGKKEGSAAVIYVSFLIRR